MQQWILDWNLMKLSISVNDGVIPPFCEVSRIYNSREIFWIYRYFVHSGIKPPLSFDWQRKYVNDDAIIDLLCFWSVLCLLCLCARLFICALWSPAGKGLTSWLSFVVSNCEFVTFPLVSWVGCGTWLYRLLIFAPFLTLVWKSCCTFQNKPNYTVWAVTCDFQHCSILTWIYSGEPVQPLFKLRNSKWCLVSSLRLIEYSSN